MDLCRACGWHEVIQCVCGMNMNTVCMCMCVCASVFARALARVLCRLRGEEL